MSARQFLFASYNVHRCIGGDGRHDPERIATVLREIDADVFALQEVDAGYHVEQGVDQIAYLAEATGRVPVASPVLRSHRGHYGNGLLLREPPLSVRKLDLSAAGRERRAALDARIELGGRPVRVIAAHLGLAARERRLQVLKLLRSLRRHGEEPLVVLGDFNEWLARSPVLSLMHSRFGRTPGLRTFPARLPIFALDRIWVNPRAALGRVDVHRTRTARNASDHLPLRAVVEIA
jgi:endonuclease/exonuclease/phosphatase family metal-dependent hydrolase